MIESINQWMIEYSYVAWLILGIIIGRWISRNHIVTKEVNESG